VGDNLLCPGAPDYIAFMEAAPDFEFNPIHTFVEYTTTPDIVGISTYRPGGVPGK